MCTSISRPVSDGWNEQAVIAKLYIFNAVGGAALTAGELTIALGQMESPTHGHKTLLGGIQTFSGNSTVQYKLNL